MDFVKLRVMDDRNHEARHRVVDYRFLGPVKQWILDLEMRPSCLGQAIRNEP